jgi:hypothetical protein
VDEFWVLPDTATGLKTGGKVNRFQVTAIVTKAGKRFRNGKPALRVRFDQRNIERSFWCNHTTVAITKPSEPATARLIPILPVIKAALFHSAAFRFLLR